MSRTPREIFEQVLSTMGNSLAALHSMSPFDLPGDAERHQEMLESLRREYLEAEAGGLKWSKELPTQSGFYWLKSENFALSGERVGVVFLDVADKYVWETGDPTDLYDVVSEEEGALWYGPLEPPKEGSE